MGDGYYLPTSDPFCSFDASSVGKNHDIFNSRRNQKYLSCVMNEFHDNL